VIEIMTDMPTDRRFNLQHYGLLKVSGKDAEKLLQGQLSCDVAKVTAESGSFGVHCNPQGRIIYLFYILKLDNAYFLIMPQSMITIALTHLKKYALFYQTELSDATGEYTVMGCTSDISADNYSRMVLPTKSHRKLYLVAEPAEDDNSEEWKLYNILEGLADIYPETSSSFLPHELNLPELGAIDFDKGCYTGQEIIARMHYRAKLKKHMYLAMSESPTTAGTAVQGVATIIDCSHKTYNEKYPVLVIVNDKDINSELLTQHGLTIETQQSEKQ
jgi:folate-binding protein YgfZ